MHEQVPDAAFVPGAGKINLVGLRTAETRAETFGSPIAVSFGDEMSEP